jgi:GT2 family glycosyltransferase
MSGPPAPLLSVIVVVGALRERVGECLASLLAQDALADLEVLLVDLAPELGPPGYADHPAVRRLPLPAATTFAAARAHGVAAARAPVVAFLEEHTRVLAGWAAALIDAHRGPWAGVGPEIHPDNPGVGLADVTYLLSYGLFSPPQRSREVALIPGHNASYKRAVLLGLGDRLVTLLGNDNVLMARLRRDGHRLYLEARARVAHRNETSLGSILRGYAPYHRLYGALRARELDWSPARRLAYVALTPLIPLYYVGHFSAFLARHDRRALAVFARHLHIVLGTQLLSALSQAVGLLFGPGRTAARFTRYELTEPREKAGREAGP